MITTHVDLLLMNQGLKFSNSNCNKLAGTFTYSDAVSADADSDCQVRWTATGLADE
jgi:hypothetical protein